MGDGFFTSLSSTMVNSLQGVATALLSSQQWIDLGNPALQSPAMIAQRTLFRNNPDHWMHLNVTGLPPDVEFYQTRNKIVVRVAVPMPLKMIKERDALYTKKKLK